MRFYSLLNDLMLQGIAFKVENGKLRFSDENGVMTESMLSALTAYRPDFVKLTKIGDAFKLAPVSPAQQAMWMMNQFKPASAAYNTVLGLRLNSQVNESMLEQACQQLTDRHPALRSVFQSDGPDVLQVIYNRQRVKWQVYDCRALTAEQARAEMARCGKEPFHLGKGALFRAELFRMADHSCLVLTAHHIIMDAWSYHLIVRELEDCYRALTAGQTAVLPPLECQYDHYVLQQQRMLAGAKGESLSAYWYDQLYGELHALQLPFDFPRSPVQRGNGATVAFELDAPLLLRLTAAAHETGNTLYVTLLAAYIVLLHRYTSQDRLVVGTPATGRTQPEWAGIIGYFINAVVIKADCGSNPTFADFARQIKRNVLEALEHQEYPYALLPEKLGLKADPGHQQLLQVMFVFIDDIRKAQQAENTRTELWTPFDLPSEEGQNDLMLVMTKLGERFAGALRYDADLFERNTISRMAENFVTLLQSIADHPHLPIRKLTLLGSSERMLQLQWNDTALSYPHEFRLHELFERQAARTPHEVAAFDSKTSLTYEQLNRYANEVAAALIARGIVPDDRICILGNRSCDFLIAVLGVLKSGGAYIPLDPKHPSSRHAGILEDSGAAILLTAFSGSETVAKETESEQVAILPVARLYGLQTECRNPGIRVTADHLAYVIYTSGSTGKPKGAMVEHRGMLNHLYSKINEMSIGPGDVVVQNASQCFDISVWQFLSAIVAGGRTRIVEDDLVRDPLRMLEALADARATILETVPSLLHAMLDVVGSRGDLAAKLHGLRWMMVTGEALPPTLCVRWFEKYPHIPMINAYGPTECSDDVAHYVLHGPPPEHCTIMPIGRAIQNTSLYTLDAYLAPVPIGVVGELYVAGESVGRGYLNDPARTEQAFLINHLAVKPGGRLYRTGDRAKYLSTGDIEYHGRIDYQVKVRGFRIELGEIEAAIQRLGEVKDAAVAARGESLEDKTLVAYWIAADPEAASSTPANLQKAFKDALKMTLPDYMVPDVWVQLGQFPLSANGKIDRKILTGSALNEIENQFGVSGLQRPGSHVTEDKGGKSASLNAGEKAARLSEESIKGLLLGWLERDVGAIIADIMNKGDAVLDKRANLIESGFNSIKFITLSARLDEQYGIRIAPPQFFDFGTTLGIIQYLLGHCRDQLKSYYAEGLQQTCTVNNLSLPSPPKSDSQAEDDRVEVEDPSWMESAIAIVGIAARTPGAGDAAKLWSNLIEGANVITEIPSGRWDWRRVSGEETKARWGGFIDDVDKFDAGFFGVPEDRARQMDPQQRLMLETAWKAVENAGYKMSELSEQPVGVFTAVAYTDYMDVLRESGNNLDLFAAAGMERTLIPNLISHHFNLTGPSEAIDTACSSSLTALNRAMDSLHNGECDTAIVGASNLILSPRLFQVFDELGKLSSDGRCKTFDKDADGYVRSEAVITFVLKPLKAAIAGQDHIHGVLRGCTTRHIGRSSAFTAPKSTAQSDLINLTYQRHGIDLTSLDYVELHGPGISLVDAVEVNALSKTMKEAMNKLSPEAKASYSCGIGSVKSNLGHMEAASGLAGLLKIVLAMQHGVIPANVNLKEINPYLELADSPLHIIQSNTPWPDKMAKDGQRQPRRAGISSFGGGGVIAHAIVEEFIGQPQQPKERSLAEAGNKQHHYAIPISAKSEASLRQYAADLAAFIHPLISRSAQSNGFLHINYSLEPIPAGSCTLPEIAYTLQAGREEFGERLGVTASNLTELHRKLSLYSQGKLAAHEFYRGTVDVPEAAADDWAGNNEESASFMIEPSSDHAAEYLIQKWASGAVVRWHLLYATDRPDRVPLPTYPFHKERHWVESSTILENAVAGR